MIEVKTFREGPGRQMRCAIRGSVMELAEDTLFTLRQIWKQIDQDSHEVAALFTAVITDAVNGRDGFNLWCVPESQIEIGFQATGDAEEGSS